MAVTLLTCRIVNTINSWSITYTFLVWFR